MRDTSELPDAGDDAVEIAALACLTPMEYGRRRRDEAKRLGVPVAMLDAEVVKARAALTGGQDRPPLFREPDPWPEAVATATVLDATVAAVRRHVVLPAAAADCVALWVLHTWVFDRFQHTPRLAVTSPTMRCGKSTLLDLLHALSKRALKADNISPAAIFRVVEAHTPTLAIDEADSFLAGREELRGILNSGFEMHGSVIRVEKAGEGEFEPVTFSTFAPVAIAAIGKIPGTLADRAVPIILKRKLPGERVEKMRLPASRKALADLARKLARWSDDHAASLSLEPDVPEILNDRQGDIAAPLLSIADLAGGAWGKRARDSLIATFGVARAREGDSDTLTTLLRDIREIFATDGIDGRIRSTCLLDALVTREESPWRETNRGRPISARQLSDLIQPLGVRTRPTRMQGDVVKAYHLADFAEPFARYLDSSPAATPSESGYVVTGEESLGVEGDSASVTGGWCNRSENGLKPAEYLGCNHVTASDPPTGERGESVALADALHAAAKARGDLTATMRRVLPGPAGERGCAEPGISLSDLD